MYPTTSKMTNNMLTLGNARYDPSVQLLWHANGREIPLRPRTLKVLDFFIQSNGALQSKDALLQSVWQGLSVTDDSLVQCISEIRQAIGDRDHNILQTLHKRGYRLNVARVLDESPNVPHGLAIQATPMPTASDLAINLTVESIRVPLALAVMAFTSRKGDERSEQFAKAFSGDLLSKLVIHPGMPLVSRQASFALQGTVMSASEISARLQARYVVTGQVQVTKRHAKWSIEMLDGETNLVVWSEASCASCKDVAADTDTALERIAGTIQNYFLESKFHRALANSPSPDEPFNDVARVKELMFRSTPESVLEAQRLSEILVTQHPHYAMAWAMHANIHFWDMIYCLTGLWTEDRVIELLLEINKAIELDRLLPWSYNLLAHALCLNGQFEEAQVAMNKARDLAPRDVIQLTAQAHLKFFSGHLEDALRCVEEAHAIAPMRTGGNLAAHQGRALVFLNRTEEGIEKLTQIVVLIPGHNWARMALIVALEESGMHSKAASHYAALLQYTRKFNRAFFGRCWSRIPEIRDRYVAALSAHGFS
jgi:adenylate cyclase